LIKEKDELARTKGKLAVERETTSAKSGRGMDEIAGGNKVWHSNRAAEKSKTAQKKRVTRNSRHS
jgi:hypothetical protein